eukprot:g2770.t1
MRGLVVVAVAAAVVQGSVVDIDSVVDSESAFAKLDAWAFGDEMDLTPGLAGGEASRDNTPFTRESALLAEDGSFSSYDLLLAQDGSYSSYDLLLAEDGSFSSYDLLLAEDGSYSSYDLLLQEDGSFSSYDLLLQEDGSFSSYDLLLQQDGSYSSYDLLDEAATDDSIFTEDGVVTPIAGMPNMPGCMSDCAGIPSALASAHDWCTHVAGYSAGPMCLSDCSAADVATISKFQEHCENNVLNEEGDVTMAEKEVEHSAAQTTTTVAQTLKKHSSVIAMVMAGVAFLLTVVAMVLKARTVRAQAFGAAKAGAIPEAANMSPIHTTNEGKGVLDAESFL